MSQADGSSATIKSSENICLQVAAVAGGWRESIVVLVMVLAPVGLAIILIATGVFVIAGWQIVRGVPVEIPAYGLLSYIVISWIDVAAGSGRRIGG